MSDDNTPTTEDFRREYASGKTGCGCCSGSAAYIRADGTQVPASTDFQEATQEFDRWLAGVKAEAWEQGATHAWNEGIRRQNPEVADAIEDDFLPYSVRKNNPHKGGHR